MLQIWILYFNCLLLEDVYMDKAKLKYIEFLNNSIEFQNWLKKSPFQIIDFRLTDQKEIKILFKNNYLFEK